MPLQLATQCMTFPARPLHILNSDCIIQNVELNGKPCRVLWLNACLGAGLEELLDALVPEALDHATIVYRNATLYDFILPSGWFSLVPRDCKGAGSTKFFPAILPRLL